MKIGIRSILTTLALVCVALLPTARAVSPAPDGGYPGGNTAEGQSALFSLTSGTYNTAIGLFSLESNTGGTFNTGVGAGTLLANAADQNTATGAGALLSNSIGVGNTANGTFALFNNTGGGVNTANGTFALFNNTTGNQNTASGVNALLSNSTGIQNTANGYQALSSNTTGNENTASGINALFSNTTGTGNTALGFGAGGDVTTANNVICIGTNGADIDNSCFIGNIFGVTTNGTATPVLIDAAGQLGTISSSRRFKKEITPMDKASEAILALKPVTFHYKSDNTNTPQFGLIAEEVAKVNPELIVRDKNGEIYTVRYDAVNAMLLNEFLKDHRKVQEQDRRIQEQEALITQLKKEVETVVAHAKAQDSKIQKVSEQLELNRTAPLITVDSR